MIEFCQNNGMQLLVENRNAPPFNSPRQLKDLFKKYPYLGMTFDTGHSNFSPTIFSDKIQHVHLHYGKNKQLDHLPPKNKKALKNVLRNLNNLGTQLTVTLEIFNYIKKVSWLR